MVVMESMLAIRRRLTRWYFNISSKMPTTSISSMALLMHHSELLS